MAPDRKTSPNIESVIAMFTDTGAHRTPKKKRAALPAGGIDAVLDMFTPKKCETTNVLTASIERALTGRVRTTLRVKDSNGSRVSWAEVSEKQSRNHYEIINQI